MRKRGMVAVGLCVLAGAMALPSSVLAAGWLPNFLISGPGENGSESTAPEVAIAPNGNVTVVWSDEFTASSRIKSKTFHPDGSVGQTRPLSTSAAGVFANDPQIGIDGQGIATVAWSEGPSSSGRSAERIRLDASGSPIGAEQAVSPGGDDATQVALDVNPGGEALVSWLDNTTAQVRFRRIAANGTLGSAANLSAHGAGVAVQSNAGIGIDAQGRGFAAWNEADCPPADPCSFGVRGRTFDGTDTLNAVRTLNTDLGSSQDNMRVVIDSTGKGTVTWEDTNTSVVHENQVDAAGNATGEQDLSDAAFGSANRDLAIGPDDTVTTLFEESDPVPPFPNHARTRQLAPDGSIGPTRTVISGDIDPAAVAIGPHGNGLVAYQTFPVSHTRAAVRPIDSTGEPSGPEAVLSDDGKNAEDLGVVLGADGSGFAVWNRPNPEFSPENYLQVEGAVFDAIRPNLSAVIPAGGTATESLVMAATASDRAPVTFAWNFGDGSTGSGDIVQHTYAAPGTYTASVTATDAAGNATTAQGQVKVSAAGAPPSAGATGQQAAALAKCKKKRNKKKRKGCINKAKRLPV